MKEFKKLHIKEQQFTFYDKKIVALSNGNLVFYDLNENIVQKENLDKSLSERIILVESEKFDKLSFFDFSTFILYCLE